MKKKLAILLVGTMIASSILAGCGSKKSEPTKKETSGELKGDITFWHSFTQGPRMEVIQQTADQFMKDNPGVKIKIETFSWGDFYTKWTTGLASGNGKAWLTYLLREAYNKGAKTVLFTTNNGKKFSEYYSEVVALSSLRHLNYGNVISPQFPILIILDIIYAYYVEQNKYIREGMHDSTLCALEE